MELKGLNLKTPQEMCDSANQVDSGLHHEEAPKFSFKAYWFKFLGNISAKIDLIFRW